MSEHQFNGETRLGLLAERGNASGEWWKQDAPARNALELPTRVLKALENADIFTVAQLKAAGPARLRGIPHIGKQGFEQIIELLRALDAGSAG